MTIDSDTLARLRPEVREGLNEWIGIYLLAVSRVRQPSIRLIVAAWLAGLRAAGINADLAKQWSRGSKYPKTLPLVIEFECPFEHRTEDRHDFAKVWLLIEDDGWPRHDPASPCPTCTDEDLERWLLNCPACDAGEDSGTHLPNHEAIFSESDCSPVGWVMYELETLADQAHAEWWGHHPHEARAQFLLDHEGERLVEERADRMMAIYRERVTTTVVVDLSKAKPKWTPDDAADWLDGLRGDDGEPLVPLGATARQTWALVQDLAGRPPKNTVEAAQTLRRKGS
ncbi:hypothetical protein [Demequina maris]|uniref:hypothetical protein n=1 Tax=Demequina maris TaxID=1638982 RepID=UPI00078605DE|nr:hypothetical protein [Demequina maris]